MMLLHTRSLRSLSALAVLSIAAPPGSSGAEALLTDDLWGGHVEGLDEEAAAARRSCSSPELPTCGGLSLFYSRSTASAEADSARGTSLRRLACEDGFGWACYELSERTDSTSADDPRRLRRDLLRLACDHDEPRGCLYLGDVFRSGDGVPVDRDRAGKLYAHACENGRPTACWRLAEMQVEGLAETEEVPDESWQLFDRACVGGVGVACERLGEFSRGADNDLFAARFFGLACQRKVVSACHAYAGYRYHGRGVVEDRKMAMELYAHACDQGVAESCGAYAERLRDRDEPGDGALAAEAAAEACRLGFSEACASDAS